jgi:hypothetical protein
MNRNYKPQTQSPKEYTNAISRDIRKYEVALVVFYVSEFAFTKAAQQYHIELAKGQWPRNLVLNALNLSNAMLQLNAQLSYSRREEISKTKEQ